MNHDLTFGPEAMQAIQNEYMPAVERMQKNMERTAKPVKVLFRKTTTDESLRKNLQKSMKEAQTIGVIKDFVENVKKDSQFYGLARHGKDPAIIAKNEEHPTASFI